MHKKISDYFSDLTNLAREAAFGPLRKISSEDGYDIRTIPLDEICPISLEDFESSLTKVRTSVDKETLGSFEKWNVEEPTNLEHIFSEPND